jgi:membrane dipeptidase
MPTPPRDISRRDLIVSAAASGLAVFAAPMINRGRFRLFAQSREYSARAIALIERSLVIDMLSPMTLNFPLQAKWNKDPESFTAADFEKYKRSGINVIHPAVGLGGPNAYDSATQFFAGLNAFLAGNDERFMRIDSLGDFARVKSKKVAVILPERRYFK